MTEPTTGGVANSEWLAEAVLSCRVLVGRYVVGFDDATCVVQRAGLPNHAAWCLGHCALTMHRVASILDGGTLPPGDFGVGALGSRNDGVYGVEGVAFGSEPTGDASVYPRVSRGVEIFNAACDRLAGAVRAAPEGALDAEVQWGGVVVPMRLLVVRMVFHNGFHTGQIADLRRGLGLGSIFG